MLRLHNDAAFLTDYSLRDGKPHLLDAPVSGGIVSAGRMRIVVHSLQNRQRSVLATSHSTQIDVPCYS